MDVLADGLASKRLVDSLGAEHSILLRPLTDANAPHEGSNTGAVNR